MLLKPTERTNDERKTSADPSKTLQESRPRGYVNVELIFGAEYKKLIIYSFDAILFAKNYNIYVLCFVGNGFLNSCKKVSKFFEF